MTNAQHAAEVWHRQGRQAAAECLAGRSLGDVDQFLRDVAEFRTLGESSMTEPTIEAARWVFANQWRKDAPEVGP